VSRVSRVRFGVRDRDRVIRVRLIHWTLRHRGAMLDV